jgi:serine protease Do
MITTYFAGLTCVLAACGVGGQTTDPSFADVARAVNKKVVKVYGAGGFRGITAYCTGVVVSPEGHILTVYSPTLDSASLRCYLYDGTKHELDFVAAEPRLDVALLKIKDAERFKEQPLDFVDLTQPPPNVQVGDWILGFSNAFEVATRDEPVTVMRGVIAAITPLAARRGVVDAPYKETAFIVDAITNNPGSHGGLITTRRGEAIGLIGKELRNKLTETWVNYAIPLFVVRDFALKAKRGEYKTVARDDGEEVRGDKRAFHGLILVPDVVDRTPPYVEEVVPDSPAAKAGLKTDDLVVFLRVPRDDAPNEREERVVNSCRAFKELMAPLDPGTTITVVVRRGNQLLSLDLTLGPAQGPPGKR